MNLMDGLKNYLLLKFCMPQALLPDHYLSGSLIKFECPEQRSVKVPGVSAFDFTCVDSSFDSFVSHSPTDHLMAPRMSFQVIASLPLSRNCSECFPQWSLPLKTPQVYP